MRVNTKTNVLHKTTNEFYVVGYTAVLWSLECMIPALKSWDKYEYSLDDTCL